MPTASPLFSIIIPTYNRAHLIGDTIESVLQQGFSDFEVLIVDDGSKDNTEEKVKKFSDDRLHYFKMENVERGAARNFGLRNSRGTYVNFFDSDDLYYPCLSAVSEFVLNNGIPYVVYGDIDNLAPDGSVVKGQTLPYSSFRENILFNNFLACGSVFLKREVAKDFPFSDDRRLSGSEDWELWLRLYAEFDFQRIPITIFKQRQHSERSLITADAERVTEREKLFAKLISEHRTILRKRFSDNEINLLMADRMTLIALTQFVGGNRKLCFHYWRQSFRLSVRVLKRRRFLAVAKKLMFERL